MEIPLRERVRAEFEGAPIKTTAAVAALILAFVGALVAWFGGANLLGLFLSLIHPAVGTLLAIDVFHSVAHRKRLDGRMVGMLWMLQLMCLAMAVYMWSTTVAANRIHPTLVELTNSVDALYLKVNGTERPPSPPPTIFTIPILRSVVPITHGVFATFACFALIRAMQWLFARVPDEAVADEENEQPTRGETREG